MLSTAHSVTALFLASILIWILICSVGLLWFTDKSHGKKIVITAFIAVLIASACAQSVKTFFPYERPYELFGTDPLTATTPRDASFPSTHTSVAFALASSVYLFHKRRGIPYLFTAGLVGVGRVISNVHFIGDVAGGILLGYVSAYIATYILNQRGKRSS
jgi:undecaprenyl-diphosphatase